MICAIVRRIIEAKTLRRQIVIENKYRSINISDILLELWFF